MEDELRVLKVAYKARLSFWLAVVVLSFSATAGEIPELAARGDEAGLSSILENHPKIINDRDKEGSASLHVAEEKGYLAIAR